MRPAGLSVLVIVIRFVWIYPAAYLPMYRSPRLSWHGTFAIAFTGIRGVGEVEERREVWARIDAATASLARLDGLRPDELPADLVQALGSPP